MIALLIDADNLSSPEWVDEAVRILGRREGDITIRRAYGSSENIKALATVLRSHAIRPFVNLPLAKNTTDVSLAIDAMELACLTPNLTSIAVASGDMDFVPLAIRLREKGIRVVCVSEPGKMAQEARAAYHEVIHVGAGPARFVEPPGQISPPPDAEPEPARKLPAAAPKPAAKAAPAKSEQKAATREQIIKALPALNQGEWLHLSTVTKTLRDKKLLAKTAASTTLFRKFKQHFELKPDSQPNQVRLIK